MKRISIFTAAGLLTVLLLVMAAPCHAKLPVTVDEFKTRMAEECKTPDKCMKLWFEALYVYMDKDPKAGLEMLQLISTNDLKFERTFFYQIKNQPYIMKSYAKGSNPKNSYKMDPENFELNIEKSFEWGKMWRIEMRSSGADLPRPVYLKKGSDGLYKVKTFANLYVGIRKPGTED